MNQIAVPPFKKTPIAKGVGFALRPDGKMVYSIGASRSGKSQFVLSQVIGDPRLLVWDVEGEYAASFRTSLGIEVAEGPQQLMDALRASNGPSRIAYMPTEVRKDFDLFCALAFQWGKTNPASIVCEELAGSTNSGKAEGHWGVLVSRGLKYGINIYGVVQRGQETSKSLMGNATVLNICRPNTDSDADYLVKMLGLNRQMIPETDLEMIQRYKDRSISRGRIQFENNLPYLERVV